MGEHIEKAYRALMQVVRGTPITKKVLERPTFPFLHKLIEATIGYSGIFADQHLHLVQLSTKEQKVITSRIIYS